MARENIYVVSMELYIQIIGLMNFYQYPFNLVAQPLPEAAQQIVTSGLLPLELLGGGAVTLDSWGLLPFILILLVILKVIR